MEEILCEVNLSDIRVSPFQPRRHFSEEELDELAKSIKAVGLIHPPVVRKIMNRDKILYYELIAGERRWRAMQKLKMEKILVLVRISTDLEAAKATLIENLQRVDLDPLDTAHSFKRLIEVFNMTQEEVAEKVGKKRSTVANYLRLLQLPNEIQSSLSSKSLTMGHAKALLSLEDEKLQNQLHNLIVNNHLTVRQAEKESHAINASHKKKKTAKKELHLQALEEKLKDHFGTKVTIHATTQKKWLDSYRLLLS